MDLSPGLDNAFARIANEHQARAAEARAQRLREASEHPPVEFGKADSQRDAQSAEAADPAAVYDKLHDRDKGRFLDVEA